MNNKRGSVGGIILLVLILMIASAIGGAYGFSVIDGKMAAKDAQKEISSIRLSDYDTPEASEIQGYIDQASRDLETAGTRKEVYGILDGFKTDVSRVKTKTEKELEEARKEIEEARKNNTSSDTGTQADTSAQPGTATDDESNYKNNEFSNSGSENEKKEGSGLLNSLFGGSEDTTEDDTDV